MEIIEEKFEDESEKDGYYYSGIVYLIRDGDLSCKARSYNDEPDLVSILSVKVAQRSIAGEVMTTAGSPYDEFDREAIARIRDVLRAKGHRKIDVLTSCGYMPLNIGER